MNKEEALGFGWKYGCQTTVEHKCILEVGEFTFKECDFFNLVNAVEQATLERAAKVCGDIADKAHKDGVYIECSGKDASHSYGQAQAAKLAEFAIRALKDSND